MNGCRCGGRHDRFGWLGFERRLAERDNGDVRRGGNGRQDGGPKQRHDQQRGDEQTLREEEMPRRTSGDGLSRDACVEERRLFSNMNAPRLFGFCSCLPVRATSEECVQSFRHRGPRHRSRG